MPPGRTSGRRHWKRSFAAVAGCFGAIGRFVAHQQKIELRGMRFELEADDDPAGLLGRDPDVRPGFFQELRVKVDIDADLSRAEKQALLELIERRCPVADNLAHGTRLVSQLLEANVICESVGPVPRETARIGSSQSLRTSSELSP
ncbi:hypothetical protein SSTU70S_07100 [Stutzerimonas stutzeri]